MKKARVLYRIAAVLLLLYALGHGLGFRQINPEWQGTAALIQSMQSIHFDAQGFDRTYWDFFSAFGFFCSVFLLFSATVAWLLGGLRAESFGTLGRRIS